VRINAPTSFGLDTLAMFFEYVLRDTGGDMQRGFEIWFCIFSG
jgi:hypothetical protein